MLLALLPISVPASMGSMLLLSFQLVATQTARLELLETPRSESVCTGKVALMPIDNWEYVETTLARW